MAVDIITSKQDANQVLRLAFDDATQSLRTTGSAAATTTVIQPDGSLLHTTVDSSALPAGAATETKQDDQIAQLADIQTASENTATSVASIDTKLSSPLPLSPNAATESSLSYLAGKTSASLVSEPYDFQSLSYISGGDGTGEIGTVVYKLGGASGTLVATISLGYDAQNRLTSVTRT